MPRHEFRSKRRLYSLQHQIADMRLHVRFWHTCDMQRLRRRVRIEALGEGETKVVSPR
jgi:hypothetical protein